MHNELDTTSGHMSLPLLPHLDPAGIGVRLCFTQRQSGTCRALEHFESDEGFSYSRGVAETFLGIFF